MPTPLKKHVSVKWPLAVCLATACAHAAHPQTQTVPVVPVGSDSLAVVVRPPEWWFEFSSAGDLSQRNLYVGSVWENVSDRPLTIDVRYDTYLADGRAFQGCDGQGSFVKPHERVWIYCQVRVGTVREARLHIQIASTLTRIAEASSSRESLTHGGRLEDSGLRHKHGVGLDDFQPWVRVRVPEAMVSAIALFRLYTRDSVQIAVSQSDNYQLPSGILVLVTGESLTIPHHIGPVERSETEWIVRQ
jgi:hypothetical protein